MTVYHVITTYHLLCAMILQAMKKDESILLVPASLTQKYSNYNSLSKNLFSEVIQHDTIYRYKNSEEDAKEYFFNLLPRLDSETDIYIWGAQYSFGIYVAEQKIPFIFCEEATGMMSRRNILEHIDELNPHLAGLYPYVQELGLYSGNCPMAKARMCNFAAQLDGFEHSNYINFSVVDSLLSLDKITRQEIMSFFTDLKVLHIPPQSTMLFTQHLANLRLTTYEDEILIYQYLVDYFFEDRTLVIKPHPDDLICYSRIFPDAEIVRERFPSEFLPFVLDNQPECVATIYSTAIYNLRGHYPEIFELDQSYEKDFVRLHKYYVALQIAKKLQNPVICIGTNSVIMEKLYEKSEIPGTVNKTGLSSFMQPNNPCTVIVDNIGSERDADRNILQNILTGADQNTVFIFINSLNDYCWYAVDRKGLWENIAPAIIRKTLRNDAIVENVYDSLYDEVMYIYAKKDEVLKEVKKMEIKKELPHAGIDISKIPLADDQERIKMLEGILEATEQRLLYYIDRVKELE